MATSIDVLQVDGARREGLEDAGLVDRSQKSPRTDEGVMMCGTEDHVLGQCASRSGRIFRVSEWTNFR